MKADVEAQLERLFLRFELNEGFEIDIVAPHTWAAEWSARFILTKRLAGETPFEVKEGLLLPTVSERSQLEAFAADLVATLRAFAPRRVLILHIRDEGGDSRRWQPLFRRLNEVRNALVREFSGNLVLLVAPRLLMELASDAPDLWSVSSLVSVGVRTHDQLVLDMASHYPLLDLLTQLHADALRHRLVQHGHGEFSGVLTGDPSWRARRAFELLAGELEQPPPRRRPLDGLVIEHANDTVYVEDTQAWPDRGVWEIEANLDPDSSPFFNSLGFNASSPPSEGPVLCPGEPGRRDLERLIHERQRVAWDDKRLCFFSASTGEDVAERFARRHFDLLVKVPDPRRRSRVWALEPGTRTLAPTLWLGCDTRAIIEPGDRLRMDSCDDADWLGSPAQRRQLWLPHVERDVLGRCPLFMPM